MDEGERERERAGSLSPFSLPLSVPQTRGGRLKHGRAARKIANHMAHRDSQRERERAIARLTAARGEVPKLQITSRLKEILSIFLPRCYIGKATIAHRAETLRSIDLPASLRARRKGDRREEEGSLAKSQKELGLFVTP